MTGVQGLLSLRLILAVGVLHAGADTEPPSSECFQSDGVNESDSCTPDVALLQTAFSFQALQPLQQGPPAAGPQPQLLQQSGGAEENATQQGNSSASSLHRSEGLCGLPSGPAQGVACRLALDLRERSVALPVDWATQLHGSTGDMLVIALAAALAATMHRPSLGALPDPYEELADPEGEATYVQLPQLVVTLVAAMPAVGYWSAAQLPLMFALLGYGVSKTRASKVKWMTVPLMVAYLLAFGVAAAMEVGGRTDRLSWVLARLVPLEILGTGLVEGMHLAGVCLAGAVACLLAARALATICRGAGTEGLVLAFAWAAVGGLGVDTNCILARMAGGEVLLALPVRLQLHSFAAGIVIGSWSKPSQTMQVAGLVAAAGYATALPAVLQPQAVQLMARGILLPLQLFLVWATAPLVSLQRVSREGDGDEEERGEHDVLNFSVASLLVAPFALSLELTVLGRLAFCFVASAGMCALEVIIWWLLHGKRRGKSIEAARTPPEDHFLGEYKVGPVTSERLLLLALQLVLFMALVLATCRSAFLSVVAHKYGVESALEHRRHDQEGLPDLSGLCIPDKFLYLTPILPVFAWALIVTGGVQQVACWTGQIAWPVPWRRRVPKAEELEESLSDEERFTMIFRYCTRGNNPTLVRENVEHSFEALVRSKFRMDSWRIEVVTDKHMDLKQRCDDIPIVETVVPAQYKCPRGGKYKARAMHYAIHNSELKPSPSDWIIHLDEETRFDSHTVCAIYQHCLEQNRLTAERGRRCVLRDEKVFPDMGQGAILYNTNGTTVKYHLTALADTIRVSDDMGKFRLQYSGLNTAVIGMHGSFAVINQAVEEEVGFDHGEIASITEDTYFACVADAHLRVGVQWIDGFMYEQSPFSAKDLVMQRARWFHGLFHCTCVGKNDLPLRVNSGLTFLVSTWSMSWLSFVLRTFYLSVCRSDNSIVYAASILSEAWRFGYVIGFVTNFSPYREGWDRWLLLFVMNITLFIFPIGMLELGGVLYGAFLVAKGAHEFYIVQKEA